MQQLRMGALSGGDVQEILNISHAIVDENTRESLFANTLKLMEPAMGSSSSVFFQVSGSPSSYRFVEGSSRGVPAAAPKVWSDRYQLEDPFVGAMLDNLEQKALPVAVSSELVSHREYVKSDFYNLFLKPQSIYHVMVVGLLLDGEPVGLFGFHRPYGAAPFSEREVTKAALVAPALAASISKVQAEEASRERQWIVDALARDIPAKGVIVLDGKFDVTYANDGARELLNIPGAGTVASGKLSSELRRACESLIGERSPPEQIDGQRLRVKVHTIDRGAGDVRYTVYLGPQTHEVIVEEQLLRHGLTAREIEIVQLVVAGMTNPQVADSLCISRRTVQNHLRSIFAKVGVHNRTSLLYRLASSD